MTHPHPSRRPGWLGWRILVVAVVGGLVWSVVSPLLAVIPAARAALSWPALVLVLGVLALGGLSVWVATRLATRGPLLGALREE